MDTNDFLEAHARLEWRAVIASAFVAQAAIREGWSFRHEPGEERFSVPDRLIATRGERSQTFRSLGEFARFFEIEKEAGGD